MAFKLKDLMINLIPPGPGKGRPDCAPASAAQFCGTASAGAGFCGTPSAGAAGFCGTASAGAPAGFCGTPSAGAAGFCGTASAGAQFCGTPSAGAGFCGTASAGVAGDPRAALEGLVLLKQQLLHALAQVEEHEKALEAACRPQSLEEAEELERHLRGALEELEQHKRNLRQPK
jgi:hypothetical protein